MSWLWNSRNQKSDEWRVICLMRLTRILYQMTRTVNIGQQQVQLTGATPDIVDKVVAFQPFQDWVKRLDKEQRDRQEEMDISSIEIQSTDVFSSDKLGFVKFKANVKFKDTGKNAPGITFMVYKWCGMIDVAAGFYIVCYI